VCLTFCIKILDILKDKVVIIGSGFSSLSAAAYMAQAGFEVEVLEKNKQLGGRARQLREGGFTFDMGPTWYWMPDVFERFFNDFGKSTADYFDLEQLDPGYRVYFDKLDWVDISKSLEQIIQTFESIEPGAGAKLRKFIRKAEKNYNIAIKDLVYKPGVSTTELITKDTVTEVKQFIFSISQYVHRNFKNPRLRQVLEFPVLFLGAKPSDTPLFYSFMNFADFGLGTWYPKGGMRAVVDAMIKLNESLGVKFITDANVDSIETDPFGVVKGLTVNGEKKEAELIISGADYQHTESLLPTQFRSYSNRYWDSRTWAPSALLFYVGFDKKLDNVIHHTLFFDSPFEQHAKEIYDTPQWPSKPLFYASFPSKTEADTAPKGQESAIFLIPLGADLEDTEELREKYFDIILERLEHLTAQSLRENIVYKKSYCVNDFKSDYNAFKGNAYGLANTLRQTAFLRPKLKSKNATNLFYTGQLTVPGPGVPPALISGKLVSELIIKEHNYESTI
jgi:phytoene desaturase